MIELRDEAADGPASRALFDEYMALVAERSGIADFTPIERIFATADVFAADDAAWLVAYLDGAAVGCGGLRTLAPGIGEIKRMFVTVSARGHGLGLRLLHALEARASSVGHTHVRLLATPMLNEAFALYVADGYTEIERSQEGGGPVEIWLEKALA
ncbi:MAG TPA: GNAT family N-acetyltransferase [Solirubrobacteraceae bacterium]|nr:GNAT family N-acetyltransferase [Solirubrobacteraceae bacterium]